ncbi:MAG: hypothetical protein M3460_23105 [Actinomycetota bacterium]|nr:hypothetical protein [Actinomycetota bacterium]
MPSGPSTPPGPDRSASGAGVPGSSVARRLGVDRVGPLPRGLLVLLGAAGIAVFVAGLRSAAGIVGPVFLALLIVVTIHPLQAWLRRRGVSGWLAAALTMLCAYAILLGLAAALVLSVARLAALLPSYQPQFTSLLNQGVAWLSKVGVTQESGQRRAQRTRSQ